MILLLTVVLGLLANKTYSEPSSKPEPRIIGGYVVTDRSKFAYQASLRYDGAAFCGASIIDERHVVTAAHCCYYNNNGKLPASRLTVVVGNLRLHDWPHIAGMSKRVQNVFPHEGYLRNNNMTDDIAVIRIVDTFGNWTDMVKPINLSTESVTGGNCTVSGWGTTEYESKMMNEDLRQATVPIRSWTFCNRTYGGIGNKTICAGEGGKDSCQGDSGSALVCQNKLVGIVSYGAKCGDKDYPGVYTAVSYYIDWIEEQKLASHTLRTKFSLSLFFIALAIISLL